MSFSALSRGAMIAALCSMPGLSVAEIVVSDAYARASRPNAPTGAAFMKIENTGNQNDRLVAASSQIAKRVELHTHIDQGDGVMKMVEIEEGIELPAGSVHMMQRGGDHVMFMGLNTALEQGADVTVTLTFDEAGDVEITIPVDNERQPRHGHSGHGGGSQDATN